MKKTLLTVFFFSFLFPGIALAQGFCEGPLVPCQIGECQFCDFFVMLNNIIKFMMFCLAPLLAVVMLIAAGGMLFFGGMKPGLVQKAKSTITTTVLGLALVFCAWIIVNTVLTQTGLVQAPSLLQWYNIECQ